MVCKHDTDAARTEHAVDSGQGVRQGATTQHGGTCDGSRLPAPRRATLQPLDGTYSQSIVPQVTLEDCEALWFAPFFTACSIHLREVRHDFCCCDRDSLLWMTVQHAIRCMHCSSSSNDPLPGPHLNLRVTWHANSIKPGFSICLPVINSNNSHQLERQYRTTEAATMTPANR
jgi:hypothetical protein